MPEGDTIAYAAERMRPVLVGAVPDKLLTPQARHLRDRWPERLEGRAVTRDPDARQAPVCRFRRRPRDPLAPADAGAWGVYPEGGRWRRAPRRAWLVLHSRGHEVVEFDGPVLELMTAGRARLDARMAGLGPDVLAPEFDKERFLARLRSDDPTRGIGDALLDQRNVAGIGNAWKAEGCWAAAIDPWRPVGSVSDADALAVIAAVRPRMLESARSGHARGRPSVYRQAGRPCPRCGTKIRAQGAGDDNRTSFWCPGCQR